MRGKRWEIVLSILVGLQILFVIYTNLFRIPITIDNDSAKLFLHAIEMWENKTFFVPDWTNMTTLEADCALLLAAPIYGVIHNIYISFGIANIIIMFLYLYIISALLCRMDITKPYRIAALGLILIPYSFGQLNYYNMTFFAGGQYAVKALIPLLLIWLLTADEKEEKNISWYLIAALCSILALVSGISSGPYVLLCGIVPVVLCYVWFVVSERSKLYSNLFCRKNMVCVLEGLLFLTGVIITYKMNVGSTSTNMQILPIGGASRV